MANQELNVVTGAFGYTGKYITRRLLANGIRVKTLTGHPDRPDPFDGQVSVAPFNFDDPAALTGSLRGVTTLYNTYWVRFPHGGMTYERAIANTRTLIAAAKEAGVQRIVHVSIANPSLDSPLPYYAGKAALEEAIEASGLSYAFIRPTVIFGLEDVLVNNIAWLVRRLPVFGVPGDGQYRLQPIYVEDMAALAVEAGQQTENLALDAVGPDIFTFDQLLRLIAEKLDRRVSLLHLPPELALLASRLLNLVVGDVLMTREEMAGLRGDLLVSDQPPPGTTHLADWLEDNAGRVGADYASEVGRHFR